MTLIVDDGTGLANADSYISVADATGYHAAFGNTDWASVAPSDQEIALRRAARDLDALYGSSYKSETLTQTQSLLFPRQQFCDKNGFQVTGIPQCVKQAVCELALIIANGVVDPTGPADDSGNLKQDITKVGEIETRTERFYATSAISNQLRKVAMILSPVIQGGTSGIYARVVRG